MFDIFREKKFENIIVEKLKTTFKNKLTLFDGRSLIIVSYKCQFYGVGPASKFNILVENFSKRFPTTKIAMFDGFPKYKKNSHELTCFVNIIVEKTETAFY